MALKIIIVILSFLIYGVVFCENENNVTRFVGDVNKKLTYLHDTEYQPEKGTPKESSAELYFLEFGDLEQFYHVSHTVANVTTHISPVILDPKWTRLERLVAIVCCAFYGSVTNGFFVAAFFVTRSLNKTGNVFLACLGLSDLLLTGGIMPAAAVVLLSGEWDNAPVCLSMYGGSMTGIYSYSMLYLFVAVESNIRLFGSVNQYEAFLALPIGLIVVCIYCISTGLAAVGVYFQLDIDYCQRQHQGNFYWRIITLCVFHVIPGIITTSSLIAGAIGIKRRARLQSTYRRSQLYERDSTTNNLNIVAFLLYVASWTPYILTTYAYNNPSEHRFYYSAWLGLFRSVIISTLYCLLSSIFKKAFLHIFDYCCCKSSMSSHVSRQRRGADYQPTSGDVHVHIMHQAVAVASPQRSTSAAREMQEL